VNLLGEHTDYTGGLVLPMAIPFYTHATLHRLDGAVSCVHTELFNEEYRLSSIEEPEPTSRWSDYPVGVLAEFRKLGLAVPAFELKLKSNIPFGAGLSSSASVEVATCMALLALTGAQMSAKEIALLCQRAENKFVNSPCGIMDQAVVAAALAGHALILNTRDLTFEPVPMNTGAMSDVSVVVVNSEVKHSVATGAYGARRFEAVTGQAAMMTQFDIEDLGAATIDQVNHMADKLDPVILRRVRHIVSENARVRMAADALRAGDAARMGEIMLQGHISMREDYEITCAEVDFLVERAMSLAGCFGARMTGGGFGGCTVNLVRNDDVVPFSRELARLYEEHFGIKCAVYPCVSVDGAVALSTREQA
jgi:galactokinase